MKRLGTILVVATLLLTLTGCPKRNDGAGKGGNTDKSSSLNDGKLKKNEIGNWSAPGGSHCSWKKYVVRNGQSFILDEGSGPGAQSVSIFASDVTQGTKFDSRFCGKWK